MSINNKHNNVQRAIAMKIMTINTKQRLYRNMWLELDFKKRNLELKIEQNKTTRYCMEG